MDIILNVGDHPNPKKSKTSKKRKSNPVKKGTRVKKQGKGIRLIVSSIERIESCNEPGIHIETKTSIQHIDGVDHNMIMGGGKIKLTFPTTCPCNDCSLVIDKVGGGIGVINNTNNNSHVTMRFG